MGHRYTQIVWDWVLFYKRRYGIRCFLNIFLELEYPLPSPIIKNTQSHIYLFFKVVVIGLGIFKFSLRVGIMGLMGQPTAEWMGLSIFWKSLYEAQIHPECIGLGIFIVEALWNCKYAGWYILSLFSAVGVMEDWLVYSFSEELESFFSPMNFTISSFLICLVGFQIAALSITH